MNDLASKRVIPTDFDINLHNEVVYLSVCSHTQQFTVS